jgi:hypothetical protein
LFFLFTFVGIFSLAMAQNLLIPLYIYPNPTAWKPLFTAIEAYPKLHFQVIVNPNSGPTPQPDVAYATYVAKLHNYANVQILGYVDAAYGNYSASKVESLIDTWSSWPPTTKLSGFFFDDVITSDPSAVAILSQVTSYAHSAGFTGPLVLNCGTIPQDVNIYTVADQVVVYESKYIANVPVTGQSASKLSMIMYSGSSTKSGTTKVVKGFKGKLASLFVTSSSLGSAYSRFGGNWKYFAEAMAGIQ